VRPTGAAKIKAYTACDRRRAFESSPALADLPRLFFLWLLSFSTAPNSVHHRNSRSASVALVGRRHSAMGNIRFTGKADLYSALLRCGRPSGLFFFEFLNLVSFQLHPSLELFLQDCDRLLWGSPPASSPAAPFLPAHSKPSAIYIVTKRQRTTKPLP
jgi:hypothetical protein